MVISKMTLLIGDEDVRQILTFEDTLEALENAYRQYGRGLAGGDGFSYGFPPPPRALTQTYRACSFLQCYTFQYISTTPYVIYKFT
jgi:ornithine cyclodeaminase/alanine dehydrogenase-like protein (mu-crystallin family)